MGFLDAIRWLFSSEDLSIPVWYSPYPFLGLPALVTRRVSLWYRVVYVSEDFSEKALWLLDPFDSQEVCAR